ncbi:hypothetical protein GYA37_01900 [candidate division WWE3 bacterium]|uniref:Glutamate--cysteine ligase n=1 Tax=candidate division WWE3 bacterium TaxID=2053526 RepID=A0A7X9HSQ4_UNCKA|nr:hypothetical protein [candidate division WWE3 bacterium]
MSMLSAFKKAAEDQLSRIPRGNTCHKVSMAGAEQELYIYKEVCGEKILAKDEEKKKIIEKLGKDFGSELGASCIEVHPKPVNLHQGGFDSWHKQLRELESQLINEAGKYGFKLGRGGTIPWANTRKVERTKTEKYMIVPNFHNENRTRHNMNFINGAFVGDAAVVGLLNAFQFSLECNGITDALDKLNRLFMISPISTSLAGNARFLDGKDTGWEDVRFEAWRKSHDTRTQEDVQSGKTLRIGLPENYFKSIKDYLNEVSSYPFILNNESCALQIGIGLFWRDARIKFIEDKAVVEFRPLSTQPSLEEEIDIAALTIGRLAFSQFTKEPLVPMENVRKNKYFAERYGLKGFYINSEGKVRKTSVAMLDEIEKSLIGLQLSEIPDAHNFNFSRYKEKLNA